MRNCPPPSPPLSICEGGHHIPPNTCKEAHHGEPPVDQLGCRPVELHRICEVEEVRGMKTGYGRGVDGGRLEELQLMQFLTNAFDMAAAHSPSER